MMNRQQPTRARRTPPATRPAAKMLVFIHKRRHLHVLQWRTHADLTSLLTDLPVDGESLDEIGYLRIVLHAGQMQSRVVTNKPQGK